MSTVTSPPEPDAGMTELVPQLAARRWSPERGGLVALAVLVAFATAIAVAVWPGRMSADTLVQLAQVRAGEYTDWHAGLLLVLWRPFWLLGVGPGLVTWAAIVAFVLGVYGILRVRYGRPAAVGITMAITIFPPVLGYVIYLGRDMWFTACSIVAAAGLVAFARSAGRTRAAAAVVLAVAIWLMLAARQNALPACVVLVVAAAALCVPRRDGPRAGLRRAATVGAVALSAVVVLVLSQALGRRIFDVEAMHIEQSVYIYDLAAISHDERQVLLDADVFPAQDLAVLDQHFFPTSFEPLVYSPDVVVGYPLPADEVGELRDDWVEAIRTHPDTYLEARVRLWLAQIAVTEPSSWVVHPTIDANGWGYTAENAALDRAVQRYIRWFTANDQLAGGPLYTVWAYLLVLVAGLGYLWSKRIEYRCLGWMALACLAYQVGLLFGLMIAGYRFNLPCVVVACCIAAIAAADGVAWAQQRWSRRSGLPLAGST